MGLYRYTCFDLHREKLENPTLRNRSKARDHKTLAVPEAGVSGYLISGKKGAKA